MHRTHGLARLRVIARYTIGYKVRRIKALVPIGGEKSGIRAQLDAFPVVRQGVWGEALALSRKSKGSRD